MIDCRPEHVLSQTFLSQNTRSLLTVSYHPLPSDTRKTSVGSDKIHMSASLPNNGSFVTGIYGSAFLSSAIWTQRRGSTYGSQAVVTFFVGLTRRGDITSNPLPRQEMILRKAFWQSQRRCCLGMPVATIEMSLHSTAIHHGLYCSAPMDTDTVVADSQAPMLPL